MDINECLKFDLEHVCRGCLSTDRSLKCLQSNLDLLFTLLGYSEACSTLYGSPLLCWECVALLNNVKKFQARVNRAHEVFKKALYDPDLHCVTTLSTLSNVKLETPSHVVNHETYLQEKLSTTVNHTQTPIIDVALPPSNADEIPVLRKPEELLETPALPTIIKEEKTWDDDYEWTFDDVDFSDAEIKQEVKLEVKKETKSRKRKKYVDYIGNEKCRKAQYHKTKIKVVKGVDVGGSLKNLYKSDNLTFEEMEEYIDSEKKPSGNKPKSKCKHCKKCYYKLVDLERHKVACHYETLKTPLTCYVCLTVCESEAGIRAHWKLHNVVFTCTVCGDKTRNRLSIMRHVARHGKFYVCTDCDITLLSKSSVHNHYETYHSRYACDYCGKEYKTKMAITNHIRRHHVPVSCPFCQRQFCSQAKLKRHHSAAHGWQMVTGGDLAFCVECNKQFKGRKQYLAHVTGSLKHAPNKKISLPCPECGKVFSRRTYLNNHYNLYHLRKSKHYCADCNKYYANGYGLKKHIRDFHEKIPKARDKICDICGRGFHTNRILINHRRTHTGERPFQCTLCPHAFAQRVALEAHRRSQHKGAPVKECLIRTENAHLPV